MKRLLTLAAAALLAGCSLVSHRANPYEKPPFYVKYLNPANPLDAQIQSTLDGLRQRPRSAPLHNELGSLLIEKGFPNDAEREFERAVDADSHFYPAWYNLGLVRAAGGNFTGARHAFNRTIHYKPGDAAALFQLGLMEEQRGDRENAIDYYAKAFRIDRRLLDVRVNPRILDSRLVSIALIEAYPKEHTRLAMEFQATPPGYREPAERQPEAPSPQAPAAAIVTPAPPVTDPATQKPPPVQTVHPPAQSVTPPPPSAPPAQSVVPPTGT